MLPSLGVQLLEKKTEQSIRPLSEVGVAVVAEVASVGVAVVAVGIGSGHVGHNGVVGDLVRHEGAVVGVPDRKHDRICKYIFSYAFSSTLYTCERVRDSFGLA